MVATHHISIRSAANECDLCVLRLVLVLPDGHDARSDVGRVSLQPVSADRLCRVARVCVSLLVRDGGVPGQAATNGFLYGSVFLAFARLFPDFELHLFFILPIKIKWLALLTWIGYGWTMVAADSG